MVNTPIINALPSQPLFQVTLAQLQERTAKRQVAQFALRTQACQAAGIRPAPQPQKKLLQTVVRVMRQKNRPALLLDQPFPGLQAEPPCRRLDALAGLALFIDLQVNDFQWNPAVFAEFTAPQFVGIRLRPAQMVVEMHRCDLPTTLNHRQQQRRAVRPAGEAHVCLFRFGFKCSNGLKRSHFNS